MKKAKPSRGGKGTREILLETAQRLFFSRGFHQVGTGEICAKAGINKGTFYHFFPSKIALAEAALEDYGEKTGAKMREISQSSLSPKTKLRRILTLPLGAHAELGEAEGRFWGCFVGNLALEMSTGEPQIQERIGGILHQWEEALRPIVEELVAEGTIPKVSSRKASEALLSFMEGLTLMAKAQNDPKVFLRLAPAGLALLQGFKKKGASPGARGFGD